MRSLSAQSRFRFLAVPVLALATYLACAASVWAQAEDEIIARMESWGAAYASATPDEMLAFYDQDAVFWGTGARQPFVGHEAVRGYFATQFESLSARMPVTFQDQVIRIYGDNAFATNTGTYTFRVTTLAGQAVEVTHRYSFAYINRDGEWIIVHQHSSQMPQ